MCCIDYVKLFDCVEYKKHIAILEELDVEGKELRSTLKLYCDEEVGTRLQRELGDWIEIQKRVRQGCIKSPDWFSLYSKMALNKI